MAGLGKILIVFGFLLVACGALLILAGRTHLPLGRLPGDFVYRRNNTTVYFPLVTCILLSVLLTVVLYVVGRFRH